MKKTLMVAILGLLAGSSGFAGWAEIRSDQIDLQKLSEQLSKAVKRTLPREAVQGLTLVTYGIPSAPSFMAFPREIIFSYSSSREKSPNRQFMACQTIIPTRAKTIEKGQVLYCQNFEAPGNEDLSLLKTRSGDWVVLGLSGDVFTTQGRR